MHNRYSRHAHHDTILAALTALLILTFCQSHADEMDAEEADSEITLLEIFLSGTAEERLIVAEDCEDVADEILELSDTPAVAADRLAAILDSESDPWIRFTCLLSLAEYSADSDLNSFFLDLLANARPADHWPILLWLTEEYIPDALPHLQALWPADERPWLKPLLVEALGYHESREHVDEFLHLARSEEPQEEELAGAAIDALGWLEDEAALPTLLRLSRTNGPLAARAIEALSSWPDSDLARDGLLNLLQQGKPGQRSAALASLHQFDHPDVLDARLQIVDDPAADKNLRVAAVEGLAAEGDPAVFPVLRAVATGASPGDDDLVKAAWKVLNFNAEVVEDQSLNAFLQRHSMASLGRVSTSCNFRAIPQPAARKPGLRATPPGGRSARCWAGPDLVTPWFGVLTERIPSGYPVEIDAVYEGPSGILVREIDEECWLGLEELAWRQIEPEESDLDFFWDAPTTTDFDIPLDETYSETALKLQDEGLLEFFDPGPGTIGAALVIDENRPELRDLLLALSKAGDAPLLQQALEAAWEEMEEMAMEEEHQYVP